MPATDHRMQREHRNGEEGGAEERNDHNKYTLSL